MTYTPDLPISGTTLGGTRDRIRGNFQEIAAVVDVNHVSFNTLGKGKHKFLQMPNQASAPVTLQNEAGFYAKQGTNPAEANLYFRGEDSGGGGGFEYQLTKADQTNSATFGTYANYPPNIPGQNGGWTFLPGNLLFQYGRGTTVNSNAVVVNFPVQFSNAATISVTVSRGSTDGNGGSISALSATQFSFKPDGSSPNPFYWTAVGK